MYSNYENIDSKSVGECTNPVNIIMKKFEEVTTPNIPISIIFENFYLGNMLSSSEYLNFDLVINCNHPDNKTLYDTMTIEIIHKQNSPLTILNIGIFDSITEDIFKYFDIVGSYIIINLKQNKKVLVHCKAGISRSSTLVIAFLIKFCKMNLQRALDYVKRKRHIAQPNEGFMEQLKIYEKFNN